MFKNIYLLVKTEFTFSAWNNLASDSETDYAVASTYNGGASLSLLFHSNHFNLTLLFSSLQ
jgi:hypothetical protein